jgi:phenylacetate-CoA ligase
VPRYAEMKRLGKSLLTWIPIAVKLGGTYRQWRSFLQKAERWPPERIRTWQTQRLRGIVRHAWDNCEGYRELYGKAGVTPNDIQDVADLHHLPCVTKQMLQNAVEAFSVSLRGRRYIATGGSTGIPLGFYVTRTNTQIENAFIHAGWRWTGWKPGRCTAVLRGAFVGSRAQLWEYDPYWRRLNLTSYHLAPEALPVYLEVLQRFRPDMLQAYPSACLLLADLLESCSRPVELPFQVIMLGSENLYDWQVEKFSRVFPRARLASWYGHTERTVLAPWCEHRRAFHCWPFYGLTEVLDEEGREVSEGEEGEIVGTSFHMMATPFIRYRTMDMAVKGPPRCTDCGRNFQILNHMLGRQQEVIVTAGGRYISMTAINMHDRIFDALKQFQFLQQEPGRVIFRYVAKHPPLPVDAEACIRHGLQRKLGEDMELLLQSVVEIPLTSRGKMCFLEQRLPIRYGDR